MCKNLVIVLGILLLWNVGFGQQGVLYEEHFTDGTAELSWFPPFGWDYDNMVVHWKPGNPTGDGWVGYISNGSFRSGIGLTCVADADLGDYSVSANVYCKVSPPGPPGGYQAIVMRCDTITGEPLYIYFASDFDTDQRLRLRKYAGDMVSRTMRDWTDEEIPGGAPTVSGWHNMAIKAVGNYYWCWWDGQLLPDCPIEDTTGTPLLTHGTFGAYVFNFMGDDTTFCDDIIASSDYPPPVGDLVIASSSEDAVLTWSEVWGASYYYVYKSLVPEFPPDPTPVDMVTEGTWTDYSASSSEDKSFYMVKSVFE